MEGCRRGYGIVILTIKKARGYGCECVQIDAQCRTLGVQCGHKGMAVSEP